MPMALSLSPATWLHGSEALILHDTKTRSRTVRQAGYSGILERILESTETNLENLET